MLESLAKTVVHDWEDLGSVRELGENVHASFRREMEKTWGPDHMGTLPEDYAQHVILGVSFLTSSPVYDLLTPPCYAHTAIHDFCSLSRGFVSYDWRPTWNRRHWL